MPTEVPAQCRALAQSLASAQARIEALQARLQRASPGEKPRIAGMIASLEGKIAALEVSLSSCVTRYTFPDATDPWQQTRRIDINQALSSLNLLFAAHRLRLHNTGGGDHRHSSFDIARSDRQGLYVSLAGFPKDLGPLTSGTGALDPDYYFNDVNSSRIQLVFDERVSPPMTLSLVFETQDEEIIVNNWFNTDFNFLAVDIDFDLGVNHRYGLLSLNLGDIRTTAKTGGWFGGSDTAFENAFSQKVRQQLDNFAVTMGRLLTHRLLEADPQHFDYKVLRVGRSGVFWDVLFSKRPKPPVTA